MSSLEGALADSATANATLHQTAQDIITGRNADVAAMRAEGLALLQNPTGVVYKWLDRVNGNDANTGDTINDPLRTVERAIEITPPWCVLHAWFSGDFLFGLMIPVKQRALVLRGVDGTTPSLKPRAFIDPNDGETHMAGFNTLGYFHPLVLTVQDCEIVLPTDTSAPLHARNNGLAACTSIRSAASVTVTLNNVEINARAGSFGSIIGAGCLPSLLANDYTVTGDMAGRWVDGLTGDPTLSARVQTNLATL